MKTILKSLLLLHFPTIGRQWIHGYLKKNKVPHVWNVDGDAHNTPEWK